MVDSAVLKFPKAVTHFSAGSYSSRPLQTTSFPNVFMAGDWVKGVPHGANGLSQVRGPTIVAVLLQWERVRAAASACFRWLQSCISYSPLLQHGFRLPS